MSAVVAVNEINIMLDTLGDASRLSMGALEPEPEPAKLDAIVADALALLDAETRRQIEFEPSADQLVGLWDPHLLRRVVSNLISNALKYSPGGASRRDRRPPAPATGSAQLDVRDHGMGLTHRGSRERVRSLRSRGPRSRRRGSPGWAWGCMPAVASWRRTAARSSCIPTGPGNGTTVVVALPLIGDDGEG